MDRDAQIGDILTFSSTPGYWRMISVNEAGEPTLQRIPDSEAKKELAEKARMKRLEELCNV